MSTAQWMLLAQHELNDLVPVAFRREDFVVVVDGKAEDDFAAAEDADEATVAVEDINAAPHIANVDASLPVNIDVVGRIELALFFTLAAEPTDVSSVGRKFEDAVLTIFESIDIAAAVHRYLIEINILADLIRDL